MGNQEVKKEEATVYEIGFLILPSIPEEKLPEVSALIRKVIDKAGGVEIDTEAPIKQELAYSMSKTIGASRYVLNDAYLGWIKFEVNSANISSIKSGVEDIAEVLRFLLIKAPRETTFTFAKAKELIEKTEEKENLVSSPVEEEVVN